MPTRFSLANCNCTACINAARRLPSIVSLLRVERPNSISFSRVQLPPIHTGSPQSHLPDFTSLQYENRQQMSWPRDANQSSVEKLYQSQAIIMEEKDPSDKVQSPQAVTHMRRISVDPNHHFATKMSLLWADLPLDEILHLCFQRDLPRPVSISEPVPANPRDYPDELTCPRHVEPCRVGGIFECEQCLKREKDRKTLRHSLAEVERRAWHKFFLLWLHKLVPDQLLQECGWDETTRSPAGTNSTQAIPTKIILLKASVLYIQKLTDAIGLLREKCDQLEMAVQTTPDNEINAKQYMLLASPLEKCSPVCYCTSGTSATDRPANSRLDVAPTLFHGDGDTSTHPGNLETSDVHSVMSPLTWPVSGVDSVPSSPTERRRTRVAQRTPPFSSGLKRRRIGNECMRLHSPRPISP